MDLKKIKTELAKHIANLTSDTPTESNTTSEKIWSASELSISSREVGGKVEIVDAQGQKQTAPDGEYEMEDGFEFVVKGGQIESVVGEEAPVAEIKAADAPVDATPSPEIEEIKKSITDINSRLDSIEEMIKTITGDVAQKASATEVNNFSTQLNDLNETLKVIAKMPVEVSKTNTSNIVKDTHEARMIELSKLFANK